MIILITTSSSRTTAALTFCNRCHLIGLLNASLKILTMIFFPTSCNPKSFLSNKFSPDNQPKADKDCKLGVHTASNQTNEKKFEFYWGYKNHVLVDCISGLPLYELTTTANIADSTVALDILADVHSFLTVKECTFLADKGYDVKNIYNQVKEFYNGECIIPLNSRNTKNPKLLPQGNPICKAGLAMWKDGKFSDSGRTSQKFCCPLKSSKETDCPCHHKNFYNGKKHRGYTKCITIPNLKIPGRNECGLETVTLL